MDEKRKADRKLLEGDLKIYSKDCAHNVCEGKLVDLSERGMRMESDKNLNVGEDLTMHFRVPNNWNLDFRGKIIRKESDVDSATYGVKFFEGQDTFILKML